MSPVPTPLGRRLARFVEQGGGLFVAAGPRAAWPQDVDLLPATLGNPVDRSRGDAARVGALEYGHPVFEPFRAPRSGDFSPVPRLRLSRVTAGARTRRCWRASTAERPRWSSGGSAAAACCCGRRRSTRRGATCRIKPMFLPFIHRAMRALAAYNEPQPWLTVGQVLDPCASSAGAGRVGAARGADAVGPASPARGRGVRRARADRAGLLRAARATRNQSDTAVVASNVDPAEADLTPMDPKEIVAAATGRRGSDAGGSQASVPLTPEAPGEESAALVVSAVRGHPAAGRRYAAVEPAGESLELRRQAYSERTLEVTHASTILRRHGTSPRICSTSSSRCARRWRMKLALRGVVRVARDRVRPVPRRAPTACEWARFSRAVDHRRPRGPGSSRSLASVVLVPGAAAAAPGHRRAGGALSRRARAVAPGDAAQRGRGEPHGPARSRPPSSGASSSRRSSGARRSNAARRVEQQPLRRYGAALAAVAAVAPRRRTLGPAFFRQRAVGDAARVRERRGGRAVPDRGQARQRHGAQGRRPDDRRRRCIGFACRGRRR